jgi:hypothetical protein
MGSKSRGQGALSEEDKARLARGEIGQDAEAIDDVLEAGDVLMEVLAEDHRFRRTVEYSEEAIMVAAAPNRDEQDDEQDRALPPPKGPRLAQRQYLTHAGVGAGNQYQRQQAAARQRLEAAEAHAFTYKMPTEARQRMLASVPNRGRWLELHLVPPPTQHVPPRRRAEPSAACAREDVCAEREHERRSRARLRSHDVIENRIQVTSAHTLLA